MSAHVTWVTIILVVCVVMLIKERAKHSEHPPRRRGLVVQMQIAEVLAAYKRGETTQQEAIEQITILEYGAFSAPHMRLHPEWAPKDPS